VNWSQVRNAAHKLLEQPETYPGLPARTPSRVCLRVWRYPSFEPCASWSVIDQKGNLFLRRVLWDQTPMQLPDPNTYGSEAPLDVEVFKEVITNLEPVSIQPHLPSGNIGLDGTRCGMEINDFMSSSRLSWWESHPLAWAPLREWHEHTISKFEALLPQRSVGAARREP
jgi:hypothetical protein